MSVPLLIRALSRCWKNTPNVPVMTHILGRKGGRHCVVIAGWGVVAKNVAENEMQWYLTCSVNKTFIKLLYSIWTYNSSLFIPIN